MTAGAPRLLFYQFYLKLKSKKMHFMLLQLRPTVSCHIHLAEIIIFWGSNLTQLLAFLKAEKQYQDQINNGYKTISLPYIPVFKWGIW